MTSKAFLRAKADRQAIIDDYLADTGSNYFVPAAFIDWLETKPDHAAYPLFFGMTDAEAARAHRIEMARKMASGLRIVAPAVEELPQARGKIMSHEFPAYYSPTDARKDGGGYVRFDPADEAAMEELRRQGASALRGWLSRYRGAFERAGISLAGVEDIADWDSDDDEEEAA